jgi:hypothetical protein
VRAFVLAVTCAGLLVVDFLLYESSGASDCASCSAGQTLLGWGLILLPVAVVVLLAVALVQAARRGRRPRRQ